MPLPEVPEPPEGFKRIDDAAPFDWVAHMRATPESAMVRGMFFNPYVDEVRRRKLKLETPLRDYLGFKYYPMREWQTITVEIAQKLYPLLSLRAGLRRLGRQAYPTFAASTVGKVVFGVLGRDLGRIMRVGLKGWQQAVNTASGDVLAGGDNYVHIHLAGLYGFMDSYNLGVYEGCVDVCDRRGEVFYKHIAHGECEVFCRWW